MLQKIKPMKTKHPFTASADADTPSKRITNPLVYSGGLSVEATLIHTKREYVLSFLNQ
jgi:hypothetical protein